jgi:hypothetical protein
MWLLLSLTACDDTTADAVDRGLDAEIAPSEDAAPHEEDATVREDDAAVDAEVPVEPFEVVVLDRVRISSLGDDAHFQNALGTFDVGDGPFSRVTLIVDLDTTCYPFEGWADDPPPANQNWPASCDAFDRNFEVVLDESFEADEAPPGLEVMRAITPFGGPAHHEIDLTDLANARPGVHPLRTHITTWSDGAGQVSGSAGGWFVSARVEVEPGPAPRAVLAVEPLFDGWVRQADRPEALPFVAPEGTTSARVEYRVTGHGGGQPGAMDDCIGPAEEFCRRQHFVFFDGRREQPFIPWRTDCEDLCTRQAFPAGFANGEYCVENPTGSIRSVEAPRANWCPGALTPPYEWTPDAWLTPGEHSFAFDVLDVHADGSWRVSAAVYLYGQ